MTVDAVTIPSRTASDSLGLRHRPLKHSHATGQQYSPYLCSEQKPGNISHILLQREKIK